MTQNEICTLELPSRCQMNSDHCQNSARRERNKGCGMDLQDHGSASWLRRHVSHEIKTPLTELRFHQMLKPQNLEHKSQSTYVYPRCVQLKAAGL